MSLGYSIFCVLLLFIGRVFGQKQELSITIQAGPYFSRMVNKTDGKFRTHNPETPLIHLGMRYKKDKSSISLGYMVFPIQINVNPSHWLLPTNSQSLTYDAFPVYFGYEFAYIFQKRLAIDMQVGNFFLYNKLRGTSFGTDIPDRNNNTLYSSNTFSYKVSTSNSFRIVPFVGVEFRSSRMGRIDFCFGYRRFIGAQSLALASIEFKEPNQPVKYYSLESRGAGNFVFLSASLMLWRKINKEKIITSPFDYPKNN